MNRRYIPIDYGVPAVESSAQNQEDVLINRALLGKANGFYVDVGAGDPNADSVTRWFYMRGWRGVNIEPNPLIFNSIAKFRPEDRNLNIGISDEMGTLTYYQVIQNELGHGWGLSGFDPDIPERARKAGFDTRPHPIKVVTLQSIADDISREVDFLKVDVEGLEYRVLCSVDWTRFRPRLICVEAVAPMSARPSFQSWEPLLVGYQFALFDGVNNYYVRDESPEIVPQLNAGVNCNDHWSRAFK